MEDPRGKIPRRAETSECVVPFHSSEASWSELQQASAAASDNPTGEELYMSMTEEGPSGDYKMTMQRDRHGRWMPIKGERTMNIRKAREERRSFYVGAKARNTEPFRLRRPRQAHCMENFYLSRRNADEVSWKPFCRRANAVFESNRNRMARSARFQGGDHHTLRSSGCDKRQTR